MNRLAIRVIQRPTSNHIVTSLPSGNMSQPVIKTLPLSLVGKLTVTFLLSCSVTPSLLSCGICACNSASFTRLVLCHGNQ
jgi:hypothetical protein